MNTRSFKQEDGSIILTIASIDKKEEIHNFEGWKFIVRWGEFSFILEEVNESMMKALPYAAN